MAAWLLPEDQPAPADKQQACQSPWPEVLRAKGMGPKGSFFVKVHGNPKNNHGVCKV